MWTGRGRCDTNVANARARSSGTSAARRAVAENAQSGSVTRFCSVISCSTPHPLPIVWLGGSADRSSIGRLSAWHWPSAVEALVTPGPEITTATPASPVARAQPSAMNPAPCSLRAWTWVTVPGLPSPDMPRHMSRVCTPGMPNTVVTP